MFTGITTNLGIIETVKKNYEYKIITDMDLSEVKIGSSIMCSGICLTVIAIDKNSFFTNISEETLQATTAKYWKDQTKINLEKSLKLGEELAGHIVTGHIDETSHVIESIKLEKSILLNFYLPKKLKKFICRKGSVTIDGVSLTVNDVKKESFFVNVIPHTASNTTLGNLNKNANVNIEVDILARYVDKNINLEKD
tara:strand:- start:926 stop:1513 length:588 start_codon:yes stop_codon:yes gene_type:complete